MEAGQGIWAQGVELGSNRTGVGIHFEGKLQAQEAEQRQLQEAALETFRQGQEQTADSRAIPQLEPGADARSALPLLRS